MVIYCSVPVPRSGEACCTVKESGRALVGAFKFVVVVGPTA